MTLTETPNYGLRTHRPGDMGYITHRHGVVYAKEYKFDTRFEALVARITADFIDNFDPAKERCWMAESADGSFLGCIMLVKDTAQENTAKLRLLLVDERARGLGLGTKLINESINFAKEAGYEKVVLWTQSILIGARRLYKSAGFELVHTEEHEGWGGGKMTGEQWELKLA